MACSHTENVFIYNDVIMGAIASQITSLTIVYSTVYSGADERNHQSPASLAYVWGIHRWPVNSPHKWPVTRKMFPLDDVIMSKTYLLFTAMEISAGAKVVPSNVASHMKLLPSRAPMPGMLEGKLVPTVATKSMVWSIEIVLSGFTVVVLCTPSWKIQLAIILFDSETVQ